MLKKFSVNNYRQFNETLEFDLEAGNYAFNDECVQNNLVKLALIYGENGTGKSNLGWAIFDLISHLTDNETNLNKKNYLNAFSDKKYASFEFEFEFHDRFNRTKNVIYKYQKDEHKTLISEKLIIDKKTVIDYQLSQPININLLGAENLNKNINPSQNISSIKYIYRNTNLDKRRNDNFIFLKFMEFVNHILYFRSVFSGKDFSGYREGMTDIEQDIIKNNNLEKFESFLKDFGLKFSLVAVDKLGQKNIAIKMGKKNLPFFEIVSTGTLSLTFFYYWWQSIQDDKIPLLFIDEFDCSYHFSLSEKIVKKLKELPNTQVILTTHNTNLLSNDLIRPDCGFVINGKNIKSLNKLTKKEIREVHNLEKLYLSGHFDYE